jgi:AcrR family transcriptional regulator
MPRIEAPTLALHRDQRKASLLEAGHELLSSGGPRSVTMAAVASRAGLSRPAVYEYFASTEDLLGAVLMERMVLWTHDVTDALGQAIGPEEKVRTYVEVSLRLIAEGSHEMIAVLSAETLPASVRAQLGELHAALAAPLADAVHELGGGESDLTTRFVQGVVEAAARRVPSGADPSHEIDVATRFIVAGIKGMGVNPSHA